MMKKKKVKLMKKRKREKNKVECKIVNVEFSVELIRSRYTGVILQMIKDFL